MGNIVNKNLLGFLDLYQDQIEYRNPIITSLNDGKMQQDKSPEITKELFSDLPVELFKRIDFNKNKVLNYLKKLSL